MKRLMTRCLPLSSVLLLVLAACGQAPEAPAAPAAPAPEATSTPDLSGHPLAGTEWVLTAFQSMDDAQGETRLPDSAYTLAFGADGRLSAGLDCNRGTGDWASEAAGDGISGNLRLGPLAVTAMACPGDGLDARVTRDLDAVRGFLLRDGRLALSLEADAGVYLARPANPPPGWVDVAAIRDALREALGADSLAGLADSGLPPPRFKAVAVDLDGDGRDEVLAYLLGSIFCGTGGCDLMLLQKSGQGWEVLQTFPITQTPVAVTSPDASGWRRLLRTEAGGGAPRATVLHGMQGGEYVELARLESLPPEAEVLLPEDTHYEGGDPLLP